MEQMVIRNLPDGTKARLAERAANNGTSMEAEARKILDDSLNGKPRNIAEALEVPDAEYFEFEPERMGIYGREVEL